MADVLAAASPLVDLLWSRETAAGSFDTPERRAALEARLRDLARGINDDSVRRHYGQAFTERVRPSFRRRSGRANSEWRSANRKKGGGRPGFDPSTRYSLFATRSGSPADPDLRPPQAHRRRPSARRASAARGRAGDDARQPSRAPPRASRRVRPSRSRRPRPDGAAAAMLEIVAGEADGRGGKPQGSLGSGRFAPRSGGSISRSGLADWPRSWHPQGSRRGTVWLQALTLHRRARTLHKELKDAEAALALDPNEANLALLQDIQGQIAAAKARKL